MQDIVPELLDEINKGFLKEYSQNAKIKNILKLMESNKATYKEANEYAIEVGDILSNVFKNKLNSSTLPDGKMYYNIADRILNNTLGNNYELISTASAEIQTSLNKRAGIGIKGVKAPLNQDKIDGLVERVASEEVYDDVSWILDEPVKTFSQSIVDDTIKINSEFHAKSGLVPKIIRISTGNCCKWCDDVAGEYIYPNVPKDVYRRHQRCKCTVDYLPGNGKKQNVWNKSWRTQENNDKIKLRKVVNIENKVNISNKQFGKKAGKHMLDFGLEASNPEHRDIFEKKIHEIAESPDSVVRNINWRGQENPVKAYIKGNDAVIVDKNNDFITILEGGASNERIKNKGR